MPKFNAVLLISLQSGKKTRDSRETVIREEALLRELNRHGFGNVSKVKLPRCVCVSMEADKETDAENLAADMARRTLVDPSSETFEICQIVQVR